ncbi:MAG TPA: hypothetical protein VFG76_00685 [Candidatus Polarisedimenticolia bacterium]|nr:hypothetical protein [Candidatus Polarisedimenticolia bacterium]
MRFSYGFGFETPSQRRRNAAHGWDEEDSAAVLIEAATADEARAWGRRIAEAFLKWLYADSAVSWADGRYADWVDEPAETERSLQTVSVGTLPDLSVISAHRNPEPWGEVSTTEETLQMADLTKSIALKADLRAQGSAGPPFVAVDRFFDGNDDEGSIGCNLLPHPGIPAFRDALVGLLRRPNVEAVYAQIAEIDPGEGLWPFSDTVFVVGSLDLQEFGEVVAGLQADEVAVAEERILPSALRAAHRGPVLYAWWD